MRTKEECLFPLAQVLMSYLGALLFTSGVDKTPFSGGLQLCEKERSNLIVSGGAQTDVY
jgi:hypothetical protein